MVGTTQKEDIQLNQEDLLSATTSVVIGAAGFGNRLGMDMPKTLVSICGKPVLERQLEALTNVERVIVVVGYKADDVIALIRDVRPDVTVVHNPDFASTGTAASVALGAQAASEFVVSLDGDLLVEEECLRSFINLPHECLGLIPTATDEPICAKISDGTVTDLSQEWRSEWEWSGLVKMRREQALSLGRTHVFHGLVKYLPMSYTVVDCVELDYPNDIDRATEWIRSLEKRANHGP